MRVISISGKAGAGKDTVGQILRRKLEAQGFNVLVTHYADLLKHMCRSFFDWDGQKDEIGRSLLQYVGTDIIRQQNPDYWVDYLIGVFRMFPDEWDFVIIPDCRFPNEIERLKEEGFSVIHIQVERQDAAVLTDEQLKHPSETAMAGVTPDYTIYNVGTIEELEENIVLVVQD